MNGFRIASPLTCQIERVWNFGKDLSSVDSLSARGAALMGICSTCTNKSIRCYCSTNDLIFPKAEREEHENRRPVWCGSLSPRGTRSHLSRLL